MASRKVSVAIVGEDRLSGPLAGMRGSLSAFRQSSEQAGQGLGRINNLLGDMARSSIGATGQMGRLVEKVLELGVGGGVFAVLAGVTAALFYFTKQSREARAGWEEYLASLQKTSPLATIGKQLDDLQEKSRSPGVFTRIGRIFGLGQREQEVSREIAVVKGAYESLFQSISGAAAKNGADLARRTADAAERALRDRIANDPTLRGFSLAKIDQPASDPLAIRGFDTTDQLDPAAWLEFGDAAAGSVSRVNAELENLSINLGEMQSGFLGVFEASVAGADDFAEATIGAVGKAIKGTARLMGREQFAKGAAKLAEGIFPPNPAAILSGLKHIAAGSLFMALAGGGGGSPGGGGGLGSGQFTRDQRALAEGRSVPRTLTLRRGYIRTDDPDVQDFFRDLLGGADNRDVTLRYTG